MSPVPTSPPTQEELQEIRDADDAAGEDLRFAPVTWTHRRQLLAYIDLMDEQYRMALHLATPTPEAVAAALETETDPGCLTVEPNPLQGRANVLGNWCKPGDVI